MEGSAEGKWGKENRGWKGAQHEDWEDATRGQRDRNTRECCGKTEEEWCGRTGEAGKEPCWRRVEGVRPGLVDSGGSEARNECRGGQWR